jgi:mono/diheme cytochrome c family protein
MNAAQKNLSVPVMITVIGATLLAACGGGYSSGNSGGSGPTSCGAYSTCPPTPVTTTTAVTLTATQLFPVPVTTATGSGSLTVDTNSGALSGSVTFSNLTPTAVELGDAYAGAQGAVVATLTVDAANANRWNIGAGATLSAQQRTDLAAGKLYILARTAANPNGELRGQLLPTGITVKFATLSGAAEVPPVASTASGQIAVTVNAAGLRAAANVIVTGLSATGAELASGAVGSVGAQLGTLVVDAGDPNHFFNDAITLTSADVTNYTNGLWYGNVFSAAQPTGELRGQLAAPPPPAPTLTQLQADIFTPICSGCHTGVGAGLPGVQNLTAGNTYASIVGVVSIEDPTLKRVNPSDPDNSYLVRKIQGSAGIVGVRMPAVGGPLTQAQIDEVRAWIAAGALNN